MCCPLPKETLAPQPLNAAEEPTDTPWSSCKTLEQIKQGLEYSAYCTWSFWQNDHPEWCDPRWRAAPQTHSGNDKQGLWKWWCARYWRCGRTAAPPLHHGPNSFLVEVEETVLCLEKQSTHQPLQQQWQFRSATNFLGACRLLSCNFTKKQTLKSSSWLTPLHRHLAALVLVLVQVFVMGSWQGWCQLAPVCVTLICRIQASTPWMWVDALFLVVWWFVVVLVWFGVFLCVIFIFKPSF